MADKQFLEQLTKKLADDGKLIEAGWVGLRLAAMHPDAPPEQVREMRMAFMAGAQHVFHSIMAIMDEDREPTEADMKRMDLIDAELTAYSEELKLRLKTKGGV